MNKNNITLQASLDTSQLKKDLEKFQGEVSVTADTKKLREQIESAIKDASLNASLNSSATIRCNVAGLENISRQVGNATSQLMGLKQTAASLSNDINLRVAVDSSGLQQYMAQMEKISQMSSKLQMPPIALPPPQQTASLNMTAPSPTPVVAPGFKEADKEGQSLTGTLDGIVSTVGTLSAFLGSNNIFNSLKDMGGNLSKNLD